VLINRLLLACGRRHFQAKQRPEAPECWLQLSVSGWPEVCRARTKPCKQVSANNYSRTKRHYLVKLRHDWYTTISVWARMIVTRGRLLKMAQILTLKRNYNPRHSRERPVFSFTPSNLASGAAVIAAVQ